MHEKTLLAAACLVVLTAAASAPSAAAEETAAWRLTFATGGTREVSRIEPLDGTAVMLRLHLVEGGSITVPARTVRRRVPIPVEVSHDAEVDVRCDPWSDQRILRWDDLVESSARRHGVSADLVRAVIAVESCGEAGAVSSKGAVGLMQLLPATASDYGCPDPRDPRANVEAGCRHLARLTDKLDGDLDLVLAAYNAGEGAVERAGGIPAYRETQEYVRSVRRHLARAAQGG